MIQTLDRVATVTDIRERRDRLRRLGELALCVTITALFSLAVAGGVTLATHRACGPVASALR